MIPLKTMILLAASSLLLTSPVLASPWDPAAKTGILHYNQGEFKKALESFEAARESRPDDPNVVYNLANTHYRLGHYTEALKAFLAAESLVNDPAMRQRIQYNLGNVRFRQGNMKEAIEAYKSALELDPNDQDAKFNLEYARFLLERAEKSGRLMPRHRKSEPGSQAEGKRAAADGSGKKNDDAKGLKEAPASSGSSSPPAPPKVEDQNTMPPAKVPEQKPEGMASNENKPEKPSSSAGDRTDGSGKNHAALAPGSDRMTPEEADRWLQSLNEDLKKFSRRQLQGEMKDLFVPQGKGW
ncbi:MAG: tetratricopeptide repeat protein [Nitrospinaceae bacterium]